MRRALVRTVEKRIGCDGADAAGASVEDFGVEVVVRHGVVGRWDLGEVADVEAEVKIEG